MQEQQKEKLILQPFKLGNDQLRNRFAMAPLTRCRTDASGVPSDMTVEYYTQRARHFGMVITECSQISDLSLCFPGSCGIYNKEQMEGWKKVTDSVHSVDGKIYLQIWHCGRQVNSCQIDGKQAIAPSAIAVQSKNPMLQVDYEQPREMTVDDIKTVIQQFRQGAQFAKDAGFDGVQLHGANGYLVDQFLRDYSNKRTDQYGGSYENRSRFLLEVLDELIAVFGSDKVSVRLSPTGRFGDMYDSDPVAFYTHVLKELEKKNLQYVELKRHGNLEKMVMKYKDGEQKDGKGKTLPWIQIPDFFGTFRKLYKGTLMGNDGFTPETAEEAIQKGEIDLCSFGSLAISNPDLPLRYQNGHEYTQPNQATFYSPGPEGYVDYPTYEEQQKQEEKK